METQGTINQEEFNFFSFGAGMVDRTQQRPNNADWMPPVVWDNLTEMDKIPGFQVNSLPRYSILDIPLLFIHDPPFSILLSRYHPSIFLD